MTGDVAISVRDVHFAFGNLPGLVGVDLDVPRGEVLDVLGPNGAGKTTLLRVVSELEAPERGHVLVDDEGRDAVAVGRQVERGLVSSSPADRRSTNLR